jgi:hypothetical protein
LTLKAGKKALGFGWIFSSLIGSQDSDNEITTVHPSATGLNTDLKIAQILLFFEHTIYRYSPTYN